MANVHIHLHVSNLDASRAFYERFLGAPPAKVKPGYVKFLPPLAPLNLALSAGAADRGSTVSHLGVQVDTKEQVRALLQQAKGAGLEVREEMDTDCCFANQDKFWARIPTAWNGRCTTSTTTSRTRSRRRAPAPAAWRRSSANR